MKGKGFVKIFITAFMIMLFNFGVKVNAEGFSPSFAAGIGEVEVARMGDQNYKKPVETDVDCYNEGTCSVEIKHEIDITRSRNYVVTYTVTDITPVDVTAREVVELTRSIFVANTNPLLDGSSDIYPEGSTSNEKFNFTINGVGTNEASEDAGVNLFIGNKITIKEETNGDQYIEEGDEKITLKLRGLCGAESFTQEVASRFCDSGTVYTIEESGGKKYVKAGEGVVGEYNEKSKKVTIGSAKYDVVTKSDGKHSVELDGVSVGTLEGTTLTVKHQYYRVVITEVWMTEIERKTDGNVVLTGSNTTWLQTTMLLLSDENFGESGIEYDSYMAYNKIDGKITLDSAMVYSARQFLLLVLL